MKAVTISIMPEIHELGKKQAKNFGLNFSAYITMLIKNIENKGKK